MQSPVRAVSSARCLLGTIQRRRRNQRQSSAIYRDKCGEVTTMGRDRSTPSPAGGQRLEATEHKGRPPFRVFGVVQPQLGQPPQQGGNGDFSLNASELGAQAEMDAAAE